VEFQFDDALPVLRRTPAVLRALLVDLPGPWIDATEGPGTWSPFDVVGHLIHGERTDWVPRVEHMLLHGDAVPFPCLTVRRCLPRPKGSRSLNCWTRSAG